MRYEKSLKQSEKVAVGEIFEKIQDLKLDHLNNHLIEGDINTSTKIESGIAEEMMGLTTELETELVIAGNTELSETLI